MPIAGGRVQAGSAVHLQRLQWWRDFDQWLQRARKQEADQDASVPTAERLLTMDVGAPDSTALDAKAAACPCVTL